MLRFRPDVKPPRWGGRAEVEFAVRANCERLGLPMPLAWSPMWGKDFGDTLVSLTQPAHSGYVINTTATTSYVYLDVPAAVLDAATLFYVGKVPAFNQYANLFWSNQTNYCGFFNNDETLPARITVSFGGSNVYGWHYLPEFPLGIDGASWAWTGTCVGTKHTRISVGWPSQRVVRHSDVHARANFNLVNPSQLRVTGHNVAGKTCESLWLWPAFASNDAVDQLHYQPHLLLMPVARPVYFDLGASATAVEGPAIITAESTIATLGQKGAVGPAAITASASIGAGGVKQAAAPLNIVGTASTEASGQKSASGPATIAAVSAIGAGGVKTIAGLDKEGPATITASATVGMGGVKGAVSHSWIGADSELVASGVKAGVGSAAWLASGAFWAGKAPDVTEITAAEVARTVSATLRMKTVTASERVKQVRYEIARA